MKDTLADIRAKLQQGYYQNEEHVRLSLVARVLQELEWDIWNPREVNAEFVAAPEEDAKKVDLALFANPQAPAVFVEVKAVGKISDLARIERQLRDYNKNILAPFCVITDGNKWRFYSSRAAGKFAEKCFKELSLLSDDLDDVERALLTFLQKSSIQTGDAEKEANSLLRLSQKEKAMQECLQKARRLAHEPPFPRWPEALVKLAQEKGFEISQEEAEKFIEEHPSGTVGEAEDQPGIDDEPLPPHVKILGPDEPLNLKFAKALEARIGSTNVRGWNELARAAVKLACQQGYSLSKIRATTNANLKEGLFTKEGFNRIEGTNVSMQAVEANRAWQCALSMARELNVELKVHFRWRNKKEAAFPGQERVLHFVP